jgi:predicted site-specific integrase-resolvase
MQGIARQRERGLRVEILILTPGQVAALVGVTPETLRRWAKKGLGPPRIKGEGGRARYRSDELEKWLDAHTDGEKVTA